MLEHRAIQLDNELTVVLVPQPHLHTAALSTLIHCGSRHENRSEWGLSHLVEHMLFRGSSRYPSSRHLARVFEGSGGMLQGSTWRDHTDLSASLHPAHLQETLSALSDMLIHPLFQGLELERGIIEEEILADLDEDGRDLDIANLSRKAIWHDHPMGRRIVGSQQSLYELGLPQIQQHHAKNYVGSNIVLSIAGCIDPIEVQDMAAEIFADLPRGTQQAKGERALFAPQTVLAVHECPGAQLDVQLTFESLPDPHSDFAAQALLVRVLDDGIDSRLHQAVCEERGLVYELTTGLDCYADCGLYDIELTVAPERAIPAIRAILDVLDDLCDKGLKKDELDFVRQKGLLELEFSVDCAEEIAHYYGTAAMFGGPPSLYDAARATKQVAESDIQRLAQRIFHSGALHTTLMGPTDRVDLLHLKEALEAFSHRGQCCIGAARRENKSSGGVMIG